VYLIKKYAKVLGFVDIPNNRSMHTSIAPRAAGVGFFVAVTLLLPFFVLELITTHWMLFLAILSIFLIGVLDDHKDAPPKAKFFVIFVASIMLYFDNVVIGSLGTYFGYTISLSFLALPFTIFAIAGLTNAFNLIDGLDGLSGLIGIFILSSLLYIGVVYDDLLITVLSGSFISALAAFLVFNWHPAKIFMGDSGSLTIGFIISVLSIKAIEYIEPIAVIYIVALPILDTLIVMVRRIRAKQSPFSPDKTHIHHILLLFFDGDVKRTVIYLGLIQVLFSLVGLSIIHIENAFLPLVGFVLITVMLYITFTGMHRRQKYISCLMERSGREFDNKDLDAFNDR
jgi:UDP-GlcNAc:undecaprenyl-phosphate GlcNAc-1-phosphate transferase